jgi:Glycosyl hydrolases family 35/Beta-galactosidase jelly roll domain
MNTKLLLQLFALLTVAAFSRGAETETPARVFPHPDRIHYDRKCLTIDGKDVFIYSGAFHYFRCPKELWRDRFQKIKDAGFNAVETYVAWNWSEPQMPASTSDFSKVNVSDFDEWMTMAEQFGLYIIVRPGPYICAEWNTGGYPQWLVTKKPASWSGTWLRSDEPEYLAWCKHWYDAVCPVIAHHQITRKPPGQPGVILFQIENEYDYAGLSDQVKVNQLTALATDALADGIDVPLFTCWSHQVRGSTNALLRQVFDSCNFYPRWNVQNELRPGIAKLRAEQPDAPLMTTELQGGWFSNVGGKLSEEQDGVTAAQINNITLCAIEQGDTLMNYYMLFGGSDLGDWGARGITTTYDYNAPIREWGGVGDRYQRVWAIGHMLREHGPKLALTELVDCDVTGTQRDVIVTLRRAADGSRYLFVRTTQHDEPLEGTAHVRPKTSGGSQEIDFDYQLEPFGAKILYLPPGVNDAAHGEWLPKAAPAIERPTELPPSVNITSTLRHNDPGPSRWTAISADEGLAQAGIYDNRFVFYRATVSTANESNLVVDCPRGDGVLAASDGKRLERASSSGSHADFVLPRTPGQALLLYENEGHANGGSDMENPCGILNARIAKDPFSVGKMIGGWRMHDVSGPGQSPEITPGFNDDSWPAVVVDKEEADQLHSGETAVFRAQIELTDEDLKDGKLNLNFARIDDQGWIYVNGEEIGQATDWSRPYSFNVSQHLHAGTNVIAVIVRNGDGPGGLGVPGLDRKAEGSPVALEFGDAAGVTGKWWEPRFNDQSWEPVAIGGETASVKSDALLTWYRMKFNLQPPKPGVWVPWRLRLNATGNGFLYLNGHALGRYWEAGPQHDFFLPECWLHFGPGEANVLTLNLRPVRQGAAIQSAAVEPYGGFAEVRHSSETAGTN